MVQSPCGSCLEIVSGAALDVPGGSGKLGFKSVSQMLHEITAIITPGG